METTKYASRERSNIGRIERDIERGVPETMKEYDAVLRRMDKGTFTDKDEEFLKALMSRDLLALVLKCVRSPWRGRSRTGPRMSRVAA